MARNKPTNLYPVKDRAQANQVLAEIGQLKRQVAAINAALNDDIDRAKAEAEQKIAPLASRLDALENGLLAFAEYNKDELFPKQRSLDLVYGVIGYRRSKELGTMPKTTWKQVLGKLKELGLAAGIRTKEDVDKEHLRTWPEERLALVGCRNIEKDSFWYEVKEEEIQKAAV
jgi:phage host-nuclease inhibitor protein Gam